MKKRNILFLICCLLYLMSYFQRSTPTLLSLDIMNDMHFSLGELSFISGITMLAYGLMQMPAGLITDRLGARTTILVLTGIAVCSAVLFALAQSLPLALCSRFTLGIGISVLIPVMALICRFYSPAESGRILSFILAAGALGPLVSSAPLARLSNLIGWRGALLFFAGIMLVLFFGFLLIREDSCATSPDTRSSSLAETLKGAGVILSSRRFWPLALWTMFTSGGLFMLNTLWWGPYLMQGHGLSKVMAGNVLLASPLAMIASQPLFGWLSDVVFRNRKIPMSIATCLAVLASVTFILWDTPQPIPFLVAQTIVLTGGFVGTAPLLYALAKESFPAHMTGTALGCSNMLFPLWAFALQKVFGSILEYRLDHGASAIQAYAGAGWLVVFNAVGALIMIFLIQEKKREA